MEQQGPKRSKRDIVEFLKARYVLYVRIAWGLIILFGMVGNFTGHGTQAFTVWVLAAFMWTLIRIVDEALKAADDLRQLRHADKDEVDPPSGP